MREWNNLFNPFNSLKILLWRKHLEACAKKEYMIPIMVDIDPSPLCNFKCPHCNADDIIKEELGNLPSEHYLKLADFLINWKKSKEEKIYSVCISGGGEPLMHPVTPDLIEKFNKNGIQVGLITNGFLFNKKNISKIVKNCAWIGVSMDAATPKTYSKLKGVSETFFNKVCNNIKELVKEVNKLKICNGICFKFLLTPYNYKEIYKAAFLAKSLGVKDFHLRPVGYTGINKLKEKKLNYTLKKLEVIDKQMQKAFTLQDKNFNVYGIRHKFMFDFKTPRKNFSKCWAIPLLPTFAADGNVYYCFDIRGRKDTIMCKHYPDVTEIKKFWNSKKHKQMVNNFDIKSCTRCTFSIYNEAVEKLFIEDSMYKNFL
jgi:MoaA/NifB/PqqE/SkfB family radical SAM enzyme